MQVDVREDQAILAVVGEAEGPSRCRREGVDSLGRQTSTSARLRRERPSAHSCVIDAAQQCRALNAFTRVLETRKRLALAMIGVGKCRRAVAAQLEQQRTYLLSKGFDVTWSGSRTAGRFLADPDGVRSRPAGAGSARRGRPDGPEGVRHADRRDGDHQRRAGRLHLGPAIVEAYPAFIEANLHIITPKQVAKRAAMAPLRGADGDARAAEASLLFEANVGAGLRWSRRCGSDR